MPSSGKKISTTTLDIWHWESFVPRFVETMVFTYLNNCRCKLTNRWSTKAGCVECQYLQSLPMNKWGCWARILKQKSVRKLANLEQSSGTDFC
jgi:hypothetical protein